MLLGGEWVSLRRDGTEVYLDTILTIPPATDVTSAGDDEMGLDSDSDAAVLEDVACRVQPLTRRNSLIIPYSLTRLKLHDTLSFDAREGAAVDGHGAGAMAGELWGYGARALGCAHYISLPSLYGVLRLRFPAKVLGVWSLDFMILSRREGTATFTTFKYVLAGIPIYGLHRHCFPGSSTRNVKKVFSDFYSNSRQTLS
ncbi:hypothetical protein B0H13DRAFT_2388861 [Mycena leptocephala]|nr:hypothetical protein B0H13DRAFT_2388861 [Mycena leptocephala]